MAQMLLGIVIDETTPPATPPGHDAGAFDRVGLGPQQALDVPQELKPYQAVLEGVDRDIAIGAPTVVEGEVVPAEWGEFDDGREA